MSKSDIKIKIIAPKNILKPTLYIKSRKNKEFSFTVPPSDSNNCELVFILPLSNISPFNLYYDFYLKYQNEYGDYQFQRIRNNSKRQRQAINLLHLKYKTVINNRKKYLITAYFAVGGYLSLQMRETDEYDAIKYKLKEMAALFLVPFVYWYYRDSKIIYEKFSNYARDNSFYYFTYVQNKGKNKLFYIIKKDSPDIPNLSQFRKNIVYFMSVKHILLIIVSKYFIASESKGHAYAWRHNQSISRFFLNKKPFVFLQHGVLGLKKVDRTFFANNKLNHADLFITSSNIEKKLVLEYLGYEKKQIAITGLARWDNTNTLIKTKKIFLMPTWRTHLELLSHDEFLKSDFYKEYYNLIHSKFLESILHKYDYSLHFMMHPKFIQFEKYFTSNSSHIKVLYQNEHPLDKELRTSELVITDYSSIIWDALYYDIPTFLFQFDQEEYLKLQGSYLNMEDDLSKIVVHNVEGLLQKIESFIVEKKAPDILNYQKKYFAFQDFENSKRIDKAVRLWEDEFQFTPLLKILLKGTFK
ncbi:CDP-glycerol glycerophosphotransferase family protein [Lactococcus formosensis]|uniref:CDP-glycerol glycerophosphotransferase family protein n=1 Tax=Lactococcus formosensis TaxID=1281486 RepID=UPI00243505AB|nr:CDP-glycerol glycerophosphotransferase family protein [Lactococcus formosensis]MDG6120075.1 CDP-glycerol glycerophosphotransferase family protein [Lactococcus formosensis]